MKINSLICVAIAGLFAVSCSKESDPGQSLNNTDGVEARVANSFVIGKVGSSGTANIVYPLSELKEITCCQHLDGEGDLLDPRLENIDGTWYFRGIARNDDRSADFAYTLTREGAELVYEETNTINVCTSESGGPICSLNIYSADRILCSDGSTDCQLTSEGPNLVCEWPWMVKE